MPFSPRKLQPGDRARVRSGSLQNKEIEVIEAGPTSFTAFSWGDTIPTLDESTAVHHYKARVVETGEIITVSSMNLSAHTEQT